MYHALRIFFITLILFLSPGVSLTADIQSANADSRCIGSACAQTPAEANQSKSVNADFSLSPLELLLSGIGLIVVRMLAKKYFLSKAVE